MRCLFTIACLLVALTVPLHGNGNPAKEDASPAEKPSIARSDQSRASGQTDAETARGSLPITSFVAMPPRKGDDGQRRAPAISARVERIYEVCQGPDELRPLSKGYHDWYGVSLEMTPVDALDTMVLMGLNQQAATARKLIDNHLSFDRDIYVENFEINIRLLGGLESSYELTGDKRLLALAKDLANRLLPAFHSPSGMPYRFVNLKTGAVRGNLSNPAEIGSEMLEFGTLSKLTGNPIYYDTAKRAVVALYSRRSSIGLVGSGINVETGQWTDPESFIGGGIDSYYEYLLKAWLLFGDRDFERMWKTSVAAVNKYVADEAPTGFWYGQVNMNTGARMGTRFGALSAFWPGELALSGDLVRARRLEDSCYKMWNLYGVEPDGLNYSNLQITDPNYPLRPEIIGIGLLSLPFHERSSLSPHGPHVLRQFGEILPH